jgi:hypothetical protein
VPICVLKAKASAMEATPAKMKNDPFKSLFLEGCWLKCMLSAVTHEYAGQERSTK